MRRAASDTLRGGGVMPTDPLRHFGPLRISVLFGRGVKGFRDPAGDRCQPTAGFPSSPSNPASLALAPTAVTLIRAGKRHLPDPQDGYCASHAAARLRLPSWPKSWLSGPLLSCGIAPPIPGPPNSPASSLAAAHRRQCSPPWLRRVAAPRSQPL
jgi:hypothetical protein